MMMFIVAAVLLSAAPSQVDVTDVFVRGEANYSAFRIPGIQSYNKTLFVFAEVTRTRAPAALLSLDCAGLYAGCMLTVE